MFGSGVYQFHIEHLLESYQEKAATLLSNSNVINSHATLRDYVMGRELLLEVERLKEVMKYYPNDASLSVSPYSRRDMELARNEAILVYDMPMSATAQLYVECFSLGLLPPSNLLELFNLLSPQICIKAKQLIIEFEETFPSDLTWEAKKQFFRESPPSLGVAQNLNGLESLPPTLEALASCVVTENYVIDVTDIHRLSFARQVMLYDLLRHEYPVLARALYNHNPDWQRLAADIEMVKKAGLSPGAAIELLIKGLRRGGASISRSELKAQPVADAAVKRFLAYFHALPESMREALLAMPSSPIQTLFNDLDHGFCVEMMASKLQSFLDKHADEPALHRLSGIHPDLLDTIEVQCHRGLDPRKSSDILPYAPINLLKGYIGKLRFNSMQELYYFLMSKPPELVRAFFKVKQLTNLERLELQLTIAVNEVFTDEQVGLIIASVLISPRAVSGRDELFEALTFGSFNRVKAFYHSMTPAEFVTLCRQSQMFTLWLVSDAARIQWLMSACLVDTLKELFSLEVDDRKTLLYHLMDNHPELFLLALKSTTPFIRDVLLSLPSFYYEVEFFDKRRDNLILVRAVSSLGYHQMESLIHLDKLRELILKPDETGNTLLNMGILDIKEFLPCLSKHELFSALVKPNKLNISPLGDQASLSTVFSLLSGCPFPDGRVYHIKNGLKEAWSMLLHLSLYLNEDENKCLAKRVAYKVYNPVLCKSISNHGVFSCYTSEMRSMRFKFLDGLIPNKVESLVGLISFLKRFMAQDATGFSAIILRDYVGELPAIPSPEPSPPPRLNR